MWAWLGPKGAMKIIIDVGQNFRAAVSGLGPRLFDQKDITSIPWNSRFLLCKYHINTREQPSYERRPQKMALVEGPSWPYPSPSSDSSSLSCICHKATCWGRDLRLEEQTTDNIFGRIKTTVKFFLCMCQPRCLKCIWLMIGMGKNPI